MKVKGTVTSVDEELLTFKIDKRTTVHLALLFLSKTLRKLPIRGSPIEIKSTHFSATDLNIDYVVLCKKSEVFGDFSLPLTKVNKFLQVAKDTYLGAADFLTIEQTYRIIKSKFYSENLTELLCAILESSPRCANVSSDECYREILQNFNVTTVTCLKVIDQSPILYKDYPYWTFNNHWNDGNTYLLGYLFIHPKYGTLFLKDSQTEMICRVTNYKKADLLKYINNYVLIKSFTVFSEIFNSKRFNSLQYLLFDSCDISILQNIKSKADNISLKIYETEPEDLYYLHSFYCRIISKSLPAMNVKKEPEFWLEIIVNQGHKFLRLRDCYLELYPMLHEGCDYKILHNNNIIKTFNKEIRTVNALIPQFELPEGAIFIKQPHINPSLNKDEQCSGNLVSLQGRIVSKKFVDPLSSRTERYSTDNLFGSPGEKTHAIELEVGDKIETVYLNNWENLLAPLYLLPQMEISIKNVVSQKGKYFKATALTTFEIIKYQPKIKFESANLCEGNDWGQPFFLGTTSLIPDRTIIYCRVPQISVLFARIHHQCARCKKVVNLNTTCQSCGECRCEIAATITLIATDQLGESKIIARNGKALLLIRLLLDAQIPVFEKWCKAFKTIDSYTYCKNKNSLEQSDEGFAFKMKLTRHFEIIDQYGFSLDVKCRKIGEEKSIALYYLVDARRN